MSTEQSVSTNSAGASLAPRAGASMPEARAEGKAQRKKRRLLPLAIVLGIAAIGAGGAWYWWQQQLNALPPYIAKTNGRLEAEQVEIATKYPGRIAAVFAKEGDMVHAGDVLARVDTAELEAQLQAAKAQVKKAEQEKIMAEASAWRVSDQRRPSWRPSQGAQRRDRNPASLTESRNKYQ